MGFVMTISINQAHTDDGGSERAKYYYQLMVFKVKVLSASFITFIGNWTQWRSRLLRCSSMHFRNQSFLRMKLFEECEKTCSCTKCFHLIEKEKEFVHCEIFDIPLFLLKTWCRYSNGAEKWSKKYFPFYSADKISSDRARTWNWNGAILLRNQKIRFTHE